MIRNVEPSSGVHISDSMVRVASEPPIEVQGSSRKGEVSKTISCYIKDLTDHAAEIDIAIPWRDQGWTIYFGLPDLCTRLVGLVTADDE